MSVIYAEDEYFDKLANVIDKTNCDFGVCENCFSLFLGTGSNGACGKYGGARDALTEIQVHIECMLNLAVCMDRDKNGCACLSLHVLVCLPSVMQFQRWRRLLDLLFVLCKRYESDL